MLTKKTIKSVKWYLIGIFILIGGIVNAQEKTITGLVTTNEDGMGLPGVNIVVKGTSNGTSTDFDGNYSIKVNNNSAVLVFSYVGYITKEISVESQSVINVILEVDASALDEVVVVGYGTTKKSDITGSVSSVKSEELTAFPVLSAEQALQGRAAGVAVQSNNGAEPGAPIAVKIRGNTSINASSAALLVVDGFVGGTMPQASDIESMEVLKDASATAIYGSRGANGVILVTTKKGKKGKMTVEINSSYASQSISKELDLLNADQFANYQQGINPGYVQGPANTNWQDLIYRSGNTANHQISFSGGTDTMNFYVSGNYFDQKGVVINSGFERFSFLSNIDAQITDKLKLGFNAFGSRSNKKGVSTQADTGGRGSGDVISIAYRFAPDLGILNDAGQNTSNSVGDDVDNPYAIATESIDETTTDNYRANFYADYELIEGLSFKTTFGFSTLNGTRGTFKPSTLVTTAGGVGGIAGVLSSKESDILSENYLTYNKEIGKGNLTLLAGYSYQKSKTERYSAGAQGFISNSVSYYNLAGGSTPLIPTSSLTETEIKSVFGRLNYDYDDKYLLTFTARRDGSSNFAKNEKYAFFPSGALGWKISNEDFLKDNTSISNLKLRASYGVTGNQAIQPYQSLASFRSIYAVVGDKTVSAIVPNQLSNPDLKWESSYQTNVGLDFGLLKNRISLTLDYYNIDTKDVILGDTSVPEYVGFLNQTTLKNIGEINNKGFEITLTTRNISNDNFTWTTDFNWSRNRNKVVSLINGDDIFLDAAPGHFLQDQTHILREGEAVGLFYGYEYMGVNQGGTLPAGTASFTNTPGEELFADLDGNGTITTADRKIIGDPNQDWTAGLNNTFRYKDFDLGVFFQAAYGGDIFSFTALELASGGSNASTEALRAWTPTNTDTNVPSAAVRGKRITSRFVYDGSYVRLKNLALGYTVPTNIAEKMGMDKIRLSISGQNLLTFTDYPGTDPEVSYKASGNQNSNVNQGFDYGNYPNIKSVTFSINLKF
ncbi:SusC/RagA family TonB-linked outer membrane protein [Yeosuana marina]|uniref:SusC/RagA family TonB-linked outer membrane protein n=1 Tax=Yeosuana marina TaxID=1565536 RepID=UPI00141E71CD|nr:TonB-dependent receptor [Yeosuana marina]